MKFEVARDSQGELGARIEDVAQEAIDATVVAYANDSGIDVEAHLRAELSSRGVTAASDESISQVGREIQAGRPVSIGQSDGSIQGHPE